MKLSNKFILVSFLASSSLVYGQLTWDSDTVTAATQDGAGSWNTSNTNWWNGSANVSFTSGSNVSFGSPTAGATITVDAGGVTAGSLTFNKVGNSSYTISGGSITGGALIKNGDNGLRIDNANTFTSITVNAGPNSATDAALRLANANALGTAPITFANSSTMTGFYFLSGFGSTGTLSNDIALSTASGTYNTNFVTGVSSTITLSGLITGGQSNQVFFVNNDSGTNDVGDIKLTNSSNSFTVSQITINRGGLIFTSDGALGASSNDLKLDVTSDQAGSGLQFGANSVSLNSGRSISVTSQTVIDTATFTGSVIQGQITGSGNIVRRGTTSLVPANNTNTHSGGWSIAAAPNAGSSQGSLHLTSASLSGSNYVGLGTGAIAVSSAGTILSAAETGVAANNIVLPNTATRHDFVAANGKEFTLSGIISGGGANNPTFYVNTDTSGGSTGVVKLTGTNTFTGKIQINRGGLAITSDAALGNAANAVVLDIGTITQIGLRFDAAMSSARSLQLGGGKQVLNTVANDVTWSGVISGSGELHKAGSGKLTLSGINTYSGQTNITAGTLAISGTGSIASNSIIVGASTTFDVSGVTGGYSLASGQTISGTGLVTGAVTINGTLAPGNSPGDMSFGDNLTLAGTFNLEITDDVATMFDRLVGDGANTLALGGVLNLNNTGYSALLGDTVTVFSNWSSITGSFSSVTGTDLGGGLSWDTSLLGSSGVLTVVPESSTALLGGLGALLMLRRRRA